MKKIRVGGTEFVLLEPDEIDCEHEKCEPVYEDVAVNPNGEFVQGYGCWLITKHVEVGLRCLLCGYVRRAEE